MADPSVSDDAVGADATPWESADVQLERVRQFILADMVAAIGGLGLLGVFYAVWQPSWVWAPIGAVVLSFAVLVWALRLIDRGKLSQAVFAVAASFWFVIPTITFVLPTAFGAFALATIWPVLLATPYVDRTTLLRLAYVTFPVSLLSLGLSLRGDPFGVEDTIGTTVMNTSLVGIGVAFAGLTLIMIWAYNSRLQETLTGLQESNARLAMNERQLEVKVAARTDELESASAYLRAVIENLPQGLITVDGAGMIHERNTAFVDQLGLYATEVGVEDLPAELQRLIADLDEPSADDATLLSLTNSRIGKAKATPITIGENATTETIGAMVLIDDVTAERQVDAMKTDFISTVSHELRTPLTSVLGFARIIQKRLDEKVFPNVDGDAPGAERAMRQVTDNLTIILDEGGRLTNLINDVLDISKMEARQVDWKFRPTSLATIVNTAIAATAALFEDRPVQVRVDIDPHMLVSADEERLVQVVINLLSNAHKFTDSGYVTITAQPVQPEKRDVEPMILLSVTDTGIGVATADLPLLFERFRQVGDNLTDRPTGTGLGLPICREIVEAHGGSIDVRSELGIGSTFEVRVPAVKQALRPPAATDPAESYGAAHRVASTAPGTEPHVLVVDDDDGIRRLLRELLETEGYRVSEAASGESAVSLATDDRPDLITLDFLMPGMSGTDTALALRTTTETATVPVMFVSVLDQIPGPSLAIEAHVTKPIDSERLLRLAADLVAQGRSTGAARTDDVPTHDDVVVVNAFQADSALHTNPPLSETEHTDP